jgi:hypothetical protein
MKNIHVIAPGYKLPPFWDLKKGVVIVKLDSEGKITTSAQNEIPSQFPLTFKCEGLEDFTFPIEPIISLSFKNVITRRTVSKGSKRGSVKERWSEDDVDITISGIFINTEDENVYPKEVDKVRAFFQQHFSIDVECELLNDRGINKISIADLNLPPTKGQNNQAFEIKAYSDDIFELLLDTSV